MKILRPLSFAERAALTVTAFNNRLNKASLAIRNVMLTPDIIGVEEMENLTTLQAVATKINSDSGAGTVFFQKLGGQSCQITDRSMAGNSCTCN